MDRYDCSPAAGKSQTKRVPRHATPAFNVSSAAEIQRFASSMSCTAVGNWSGGILVGIAPPRHRHRLESGHSASFDGIADPTHERHKQLLEWCRSDVDTQQFDIDAINRRLASLAPRKNARRKTAKPAIPE